LTVKRLRCSREEPLVKIAPPLHPLIANSGRVDLSQTAGATRGQDAIQDGGRQVLVTQNLSPLAERLLVVKIIGRFLRWRSLTT
jgi:hypothetical protein